MGGKVSVALNIGTTEQIGGPMTGVPTMTNFKSLMLAAVAALSLGVGSAMAQESAGGVNAGPFETLELHNALGANRYASPLTAQPQAGSSDVDQYRTPVLPQQSLIGADGNG
jgi:hypothetical protein